MSLLLKEFGGIPNKKLLKYPYLTCRYYFLTMSKLTTVLYMTDKRLNDVLKVLSGRPLYLDNYQLQHVLTQFPKLLNDTAISIVSY